MFTSRTRPWVIETLGGLAAALVPTVVAFWATGLRWADLSLPLGEGDLLPVYAYARNMGEGNFFLYNPRLGFPYFQDGGHFPVIDLIELGQIGAMSRLGVNPFLAVNLWTMSGFAVVGLACYYVFRLLGVRLAVALPLAWCAALIPWHFIRAQEHVFLSYYLPIPLTLLLAGWIADGRAGQRRPWWQFAGLLAAGVAAGWGGSYFAVMGCFILLAALGGRVFRFGWSSLNWRTLLVAASLPVAFVASVALNLLSVTTEATSDPVARVPSDSLRYGGNITSLLVPGAQTATGNWLPGNLRIEYTEGTAAWSTAGVVAGILTCLFIAVRLASRRAVDPQSGAGAAHYWPGAYLFVGAFFVTGGLGYLFSSLVFPLIRSWGRYSIYLGVIAFLVTGLAATAWTRSTRAGVRRAATALIAAMTVVAVVDVGIGGFSRRDELAAAREMDSNMSAYVTELQSHLPAGCAILEIPMSEFPEAPTVYRMKTYAQLWPYVYSTDLRWSFGGIRDTREGDWGQQYRDNPQRLVPAAREAGFCGVQVDTYAFANRGEIAEWEEILGEPTIRSGDGRWLYYDIPAE